MLIKNIQDSMLNDVSERYGDAPELELWKTAHKGLEFVRALGGQCNVIVAII